MFRHLTILISVSLILVMPGRTLAASKIVLANSFSALAMNGKTIEPTAQMSKTVSLNSGLNRLVVEFEGTFKSEDSNAIEVVKSLPFLIEIYLEKDQTYQQRLLQPFGSEAAQQFAKVPKFSFVNMATNQQQNFQLNALSSKNQEYLKAESRLPTRKTLIISADTAKSAVKQAPAPHLSTVSEKLDYWWEKASEAEREAFLKRIEE
ncbi:DUF2057 domain-containing protein [Aliikangiella marina]|uniref:DUF2057 domain-containing protein n=1 Tax=Aliikangiella marina TaxID=1712262 RepID=A0A545TK40_9GAMM|nr:DUF2057 family protein [Aliikangiella marina]TQV77531.1 DUF2057 domain-containing protein [Aliikangiella marina]